MGHRHGAGLGGHHDRNARVPGADGGQEVEPTRVPIPGFGVEDQQVARRQLVEVERPAVPMLHRQVRAADLAQGVDQRAEHRGGGVQDEHVAGHGVTLSHALRIFTIERRGGDVDSLRKRAGTKLP